MTKSNVLALQSLKIYLKKNGYTVKKLSEMFDMSKENMSKKFNKHIPFSLDETIFLFSLLKKEGEDITFEEIFLTK